jgi:hypothetical protein
MFLRLRWRFMTSQWFITRAGALYIDLRPKKPRGIIGPNGAGSPLDRYHGFAPPISVIGPVSADLSRSCHWSATSPARIRGLGLSVNVMDVVLMGRYGRLRLAQPWKQDREKAVRMSGESEDASFCEPPDWQSFRRAAAACLSRRALAQEVISSDG